MTNSLRQLHAEDWCIPTPVYAPESPAMPRATMFDHVAPPAARPRVRLRERRHVCSFFIRKVKGAKYQLRWWLERHGSVNLGLYDDEETAELVRREVIHETARLPSTPMGLWQAYRAASARLATRFPGTEWPDVLPMWVVRVDGGYAAKTRRCGVRYDCPGPYGTPGDAHAAMAATLTGETVDVVDAPGGVTLWDYLVA